MTTLLLSGRYTSESIALWEACIRTGWNVERLRDWKIPVLNSDKFAIYGEPLFANVICNALDLVLLEPKLDWLAELGMEFKNRRVIFSNVNEARKLTQRSFVKPADNKIFDSKVYSTGLELPDESALDGSLPVLIADPVEWEVEYRCFVLDDKVVTLSPYWRSDRPAQSSDGAWPASASEFENAHRFALEVVKATSRTLPPAIVLDVGIIRDKGWSVVECNPAWASGFYGCEPEQILPVLARACVKRDELSEEDKAWIITRNAGKQI